MRAASISQLEKWSWEPETGWAALQAPSSWLTHFPGAFLTPAAPRPLHSEGFHCTLVGFRTAVLCPDFLSVDCVVLSDGPGGVSCPSKPETAKCCMPWAWRLVLCLALQTNEAKSKPRQMDFSWISYSTDQSWYLKDLTNFLLHMSVAFQAHEY